MSTGTLKPQGKIVASKSQAKIVDAPSKPNARARASEFIIAATIVSLAGLWSFAISNLLLANLVLTQIRSRKRGSVLLKDETRTLAEGTRPSSFQKRH